MSSILPPASRWPLLGSRQQPALPHSGTGLRHVVLPTPLLSICVPTYHRPILLAQALRSIGPLPVEVEILVSDNSTANDLCGRVARYYLGQQPAGQWRYYRNAPGNNVADNFVACARRARGHYIYNLHDDDFMRPSGLAALMAELRTARGAHEVLLFGVDLVDVNRRLMRRQYPARRQWLAPKAALTRLLTNSSWVRVPSLVASRTAYTTFPPDVTQVNSVDTDAWAQFFSRWGVQLVPTCIAAYTVHQGALTASMFNERSVERLLRIFDRTRAQGLLPANSVRRAQARFFHQFVLAGAYRSLRERNFRAADQVLQLFKLPALRELPVPLRWLPLRLAFNLVIRLNTLINSLSMSPLPGA
jgi:glycosyltransferase involved in cell wall biosynthesis